MTRIRPMPGWVVCKTLKHDEKTAGGLYVPTSIDENVQSEGVAEVLEVTPKKGAPTPFSAGDKIIYRGFLRFVNQIGDLFDSHRGCEYFLLNIDDALAVVDGPCKIGLYGEYEV